MKNIKRLKHTKKKRIRRKDGVKQTYWVGRKPRALKKHRSWKKKGYKQLKKAGYRGRRFSDPDNDGKVNTFDCKPLDARRQDRTLTDIANDLDTYLRKKIKGHDYIYYVDVDDNFIVINYPNYFDNYPDWANDIERDTNKIIKLGKKFLEKEANYTNPYFYVTDYVIKL